MVIGSQDTGGNNNGSHPSGIPQDQIDNIMSGIANTGDVKMNNHRKKLRQRFDIIKKLGQGTYGKVQLGINKETGQEVAIKTIKKCKIEAEADLVRIRREVQIMSSVQHPNIIHIYEVFENREKMVLVMEFAAGGELYDYLSERKVLNEEEARRIFRQVATAVYYCHKHKICHRDLKLENILLDEQGNAKIADFGLSNVFDEKRLLATFCGSPLYASPEIVEGTPYHGPEVDCWSLGVLLYTLVYGSMPFDGSNFKRLVKQISQGDYYEPKKPSRASSLIREMLTVCPRKRATIEQICSHWWVNENDNMSCLELAEDLANQTPVRLDVLLSLTPVAVTADQLVVPSADGGNAAGKNAVIPRSHSVGSIRDVVPNTEAERRILDMVAAGGEAALMPSPTRTITPAQSPIQTKRKLENTVSTDNAAGVALKKKEKPESAAALDKDEIAKSTLVEETIPMETDELSPTAVSDIKSNASRNFSAKDMEVVGDLCEQLIDDKDKSTDPTQKKTEAAAAIAEQERLHDNDVVPTKTTVGNKVEIVEGSPEKTKGATKVIKKFVNKHKTADLVNVIGLMESDETTTANASESTTSKVVPETAVSFVRTTAQPFVRKCSLQDESPLNKFNAERRKSRILETAEKFQQMNSGSGGAEKPKKFVIPGVSVGNFKKEFERKASTGAANQGQQLTAGERRALEQVAAAAATTTPQDYEGASSTSSFTPNESADVNAIINSDTTSNVEASDSKASVSSFSLEDARRSMENSIALLRQAQTESTKDVNQLCAKTENIRVSDTKEPAAAADRERKLKNARAIIGNAIQPVLRHRPQPLPPLPSSSFLGNGCGGGRGYAQMRAISGSFLGCNSNPQTTTTTMDPRGINNDMDLKIHEYYKQPSLPNNVTTQSQTPPNANFALAAARQTLMGRLAAGGIGSYVHPNSLPSNMQQSLRPLSSTQLGRESQLKSLHNMYVPQSPSLSASSSPLSSPLYNSSLHQQHPLSATSFGSAPAAAATNVNVKAVSTTTATTTITNSNVINPNSTPKPFYNTSQSPLWKLSVSQGAGDSPPAATGTMKTSTASITLKSATLPRRKTAKTEIQLDIKPPIVEQPAMRFTTEMQHPVADLRSAPPREGPVPYSPIKTMANPRATSLEPKEHVIPVHKPPSTYSRTISNTTTRSGSLSRQSTNDSESDTTTTNMSQSTITGSSQPIKKSPREFIIPIAVEGGGFITPREGSIEPSESSHTTGTTTSSRSTFTRLRPTRRIGSLLSDSGVDDSSPFQKLRTSSSNRDADEDPHFTLHKLRSSRPVKKLSQDNDSQSSGEEDDDDGFEILTAENLFSTLLQRVRALTNRMNVNNDITTGFPTSSRLLSNMRQTQSPFWNQEPFGSRLNSAANSMGAPWRHSMSRDLGSDMDSMFSRTGATLPRGHKTGEIKKKYNSSPISNANSEEQEAQEPLDLADLDLSRLRLSKKDLETLSNIAPGLPKCFQEQLLAKLPPTQARKLSRTLSMQTNQNTSSIKLYKRSQSSGRNAVASTEGTIEVCRDVEAGGSRCDKIEANIVPPSLTVRSHSRSKSNDENGKESLGSSYSSEINDKYKYYSPYVSKISKDSTHKIGPKITTGTETPASAAAASCSAMLGRPPSGRLSPPPPLAVTDAAVNVTRRPLHRRISRLLRPDFLEQPLEEQPSESSIQTIIHRDIDRTSIDKDQQPVADTQSKLKTTCHVRNKSVELFSERASANSTLSQDSVKCNRRSLSRSRDSADDSTTTVENHDLADKILQELQLLSSIRSQEELVQASTVKECLTTTATTKTEQLLGEKQMMKDKTTSTIKKIKKVKTKEKSAESASTTDNDAKNTSTVIKKVKKIVKKSESQLTPTGTDNNVVTRGECSENTNKVVDLYSPKKVSKLKRPKSYPMKESISESNATEMCNTSCKMSTSNATATMDNCSEAFSSVVTETSNAANAAARESRLLRPKSYPSSKLATPKDVKKTIIRNKITTIDESSATAAAAFCSTPDPSTNSAHTSEQPTPIGVKKTVKVTKKSKLSQPSTVTTPVTTSNTTSSTGEDSKESSPAAASSTVIPVKEKIVEKKPNRGLLYAIGQKFEKLRASATSNSCANIPTNKKSSPENTTPEKITAKSACVVKKTKSLGNSETKSSNTLGSKATVMTEDKHTAAEGTIVGKAAKNDKRSRIDAMIRNLRERSVPRSQPTITSESNYIKRAISVEEMPGTFNRKSVNKVLGLFKRYDKDCQPGNRVRNTRSTSNIEKEISQSSATTPIYQNADEILKLAEKSSTFSKTCKGGVDCNCDVMSPSTVMSSNSNCPDCRELSETKASLAFTDSTAKIQEGNKERRKGLMLELIKSDRAQTSIQHSTRLSKKYNTCSNDNEIYSNISPYNRSFHSSSGNGSNSHQTVETSSNNNNSSIINNNSNNNNNNSSSLHTSQTSGYRTTSSTHEINQNNNLLSPSFENIGTYSSDSRSYQEDCASTSTFMSPTEEPELCFDTWSVCSEDNYHRGQGATPSPTVSRLSRVSQASSPTRRDGDSSEPGESVVDRIKRRSFYCRFNEKKPKRTSSIVGPSAVREYYREQNSASKSRSSNKVISGEREHSPDITQEFFRPLKLSPIGTELKPPVYRSSFGSSSNSNNSHDYSSLAAGRPRKSLNDIRTPISPSCLSERRYGSFGTPENELLANSSILPTRYKLNTYDETPKAAATASSTYYNTYNPKRRFSFTTNGSAPSSGGSVSNTSAHIDGYATMGRRPIRAYDHRTMSLLDPPSTSYRHESNTPVRDYTTSLSRSNSRYRKSSTTRSPTNI